MNLAELQKEAHAIATDHGSWDEPRTFGDLIALVHSDLSEAMEAYREHGDTEDHRDMHISPSIFEGVASELADVVIRVADMAEHYHWALDAAPIPEPEEWMEFSPAKSFGDWIGLCHIHASDALIAAWMPPERFISPLVSLNLVVPTVQRMAAHYGIDLDAAIEAKLEYNRTRSYRHGGKAL